MLLMHGLSYGPALTRNTKERASVCQSDQVGLRPPRVTSHTILTRTISSSMSFIPNCRAGYHKFLESSCRTYTSSILSIVSPIFLQSGTVYVVCYVCFVSHIQLPTRKKLLYTVANPARGLLNREKRTKEKVWQHTPPPPTPHTARSEKINKITRRIYRRYAGGRSRVRTRIPSARRLGLWVWLRKILHSPLR